MSNTVKALTAAVLALAALAGGCAGMGEARTKERVVLQVSDADARTWHQALNVVSNIKENYAKRGVDSEIQIVAFGQGIQMPKDDAVVANRVREAMKGGGAQMIACENSMGRFNLTKDVMLDGIVYSQTGVIYIIEKQRQGWSMIRP